MPYCGPGGAPEGFSVTRTRPTGPEAAGGALRARLRAQWGTGGFPARPPLPNGFRKARVASGGSLGVVRYGVTPFTVVPDRPCGFLPRLSGV